MMNAPRWLWPFGSMILGLVLVGSRFAVSQGAAAPDAPKADAAAKPTAPAPGAKEATAKSEKAAVPAPPATGPDKAAAAPAARPVSAATPYMAGQGPYRPLSPGALKIVDTMREVDETVSRHDVVELLAADPKLDWAKDIPFRREIWALQFRFKPIRMIYVDLPQPSGRMQRKQIWYLVYSVTNSGKAMRPVAAEDGTYQIESVDKPVRFVPSFLLYSVRLDKSYPDRVIPAAMGPIRSREDPNRTFSNTVEIVRELQVGESVWGVATWEDIDPRTDRFYVYVNGLTNAYHWTDDTEKVKPGVPVGTGRHLLRKTLQLNFWRPGDEFDPKEREIRFGIPGELDYQWVYR